MKMEHPVTAPFDGHVARVGAAAGAVVQAGDVLVELVAS
jgi:biotin carboxyl carrier protein